MPSTPEWLSEDWNLEGPSSRFTMSPAIALGVPESDWNFDNAKLETGPQESLGKRFGSWIYEEHEEIGQGTPAVGSVGRGASGVAAVLIFIGLHAAGGVISVTAGLAWKRFVRKARDSLKGEDRDLFHISRGGAAYLAVAEVAERFGEENALEIEAVEEPSSISGRDLTELSYVGVEPWIVFLRNRESRKRYVVAIDSRGGDALGSMQTAMGEWEQMFLPPPEESAWATPPRRQSWWRFWSRRP